MGRNNEFNLLSLNVREIRTFEKRKAVFSWLVKTFAIPKLMFRASAISISKDLVKEAESIFYHFIWNGKDKVKRNAAISEVENGGLNMLDTESMIRTKRVICLQKFLEDHESPWKMFLGELLKPASGTFLLHCNFEVSKLYISLPTMSCCMVRIKRKRT